MADLELFVTAFGRPDLLLHQIRLLRKNLTDDFSVTVLDNTIEPHLREGMRLIAGQSAVGYVQVQSVKHEHPDSLNLAARLAMESGAPFWGCIDHDLFLRAPYSLIDRTKPAGFWGLGQRHPATSVEYLFPGWCFFSRDWLNGRVPDFNGIRGAEKRDDGDAGSMLHSLFTAEDWARLPPGEHGYKAIRPQDTVGLQSWGVEILDGAWVHLTNASHWLQVPDAAGRDRLLLELVGGL